ncbi:MAG: dihydroorotate dehydrogenase electron transfer subunit [Candidatus Hermodarchaeota archaeon]
MTKSTIKTVKIERIINDCKGVKTFLFTMKPDDLNELLSPKPGQFVMVWVPGIDEVPMSISGCNAKGQWAITVKNVGECTQALHELKIGDYIGIRGPLGNYFELPPDKNKKIFLIGGGIGIAALRFLAINLKQKAYSYNVIIGAKMHDEIIHIDEFTNLSFEDSEVFYCTDDGSYGQKGFASTTFENVIKDLPEKGLANSVVYTCGPEKMMHAVFKICERYHIELYASLERMMRCGCGLCGLCALDPLGLLVCKDGPIFNSETLRKLDDFGKYKRDITGKKISID